ncbi:hypothetical protein AVEN_39104-1 [Araneus ventricosus]|uniref:Uncharacterized protein n=1 Tax=Araneus ventricosus TaxID=182803 RepID=A0A4Y2DEK3_ARAVE|nr:hypothetical protein AVEN_39104-1 [Araneus ventricosus]
MWKSVRIGVAWKAGYPIHSNFHHSTPFEMGAAVALLKYIYTGWRVVSGDGEGVALYFRETFTKEIGEGGKGVGDLGVILEVNEFARHGTLANDQPNNVC